MSGRNRCILSTMDSVSVCNLLILSTLFSLVINRNQNLAFYSGILVKFKSFLLLIIITLLISLRIIFMFTFIIYRSVDSLCVLLAVIVVINSMGISVFIFMFLSVFIVCVFLNSFHSQTNLCKSNISSMFSFGFVLLNLCKKSLSVLIIKKCLIKINIL